MCAHWESPAQGARPTVAHGSWLPARCALRDLVQPPPLSGRASLEQAEATSPLGGLSSAHPTHCPAGEHQGLALVSKSNQKGAVHGEVTLDAPAATGRPGAWVLHAGPSLRGWRTCQGQPGWALSGGAAPAVCSLDQAAGGLGVSAPNSLSDVFPCSGPLYPCALPGWARGRGRGRGERRAGRTGGLRKASGSSRPPARRSRLCCHRALAGLFNVTFNYTESLTNTRRVRCGARTPTEPPANPGGGGVAPYAAVRGAVRGRECTCVREARPPVCTSVGEGRLCASARRVPVRVRLSVRGVRVCPGCVCASVRLPGFVVAAESRFASYDR